MSLFGCYQKTVVDIGEDSLTNDIIEKVIICCCYAAIGSRPSYRNSITTNKWDSRKGGGAKILLKAPETTKVNVFKVAAEDYKQSVKDKDGIENKDGKVLSLDELQNKLAEIGAEVKMLGGVTFRAYLIIDDNFTDTEAKNKNGRRCK